MKHKPTSHTFKPEIRLTEDVVETMVLSLALIHP
jgi:hypothetical protein